jgi:cold shock CspA family protein
MIYGTVKWFDSREGERVKFEIIQSPKGDKATKIEHA